MSGFLRLCLCLVVLSLAACATYAPDDVTTDGVEISASYCPGGSGWDDPQTPIVCVHDTALTASPKSIRVHHHKKGNSQAKVAINWFTKSGGGDLYVSFPDTRCVTDVTCPARGHCRGLVNSNGVGETCDYTITLGGQPVDPTVIVTQCCM